MDAIDTIILFDMDGTLTPPRKQMMPDMLDAVRRLENYADVGIVSGSPFEYIAEQALDFLNWFDTFDPGVRLTRVMPCNGTQLYTSTGRGYQLSETVNMKEHLGEEEYNHLIRTIVQLQMWAIESTPGFPLTGTFIQYRGSMLNWSPMGRDSNEEDRARFVKFDAAHSFRAKLKRSLDTALEIYGVGGIDVTLGGSTSMDIYPTGWDKTYALKHVTGYSNVIFVGDMCMPGGNDHAIFNALNPSGNAYSVDGPEDTIKLIKDVLVPGLKARVTK